MIINNFYFLEPTYYLLGNLLLANYLIDLTITSERTLEVQ